MKKVPKTGRGRDMPVTDIFRAALPFIICNVLILIRIGLWGPFALWLPGLFGF